MRLCIIRHTSYLDSSSVVHRQGNERRTTQLSRRCEDPWILGWERCPRCIHGSSFF
jgi:hypothetical protein